MQLCTCCKVLLMYEIEIDFLGFSSTPLYALCKFLNLKSNKNPITSN